MRKFLLAATLLVAAPVPTPLPAQTVIGHRPANSPYQDIRPSQRLTFLGGYYDAQKDEIGATPRGGLLLGVRYSVPVGGPGEFFVRGERVSSHRTLYDPTLPPAARKLGNESMGLYMLDLGFGLNLTGERTWHGIIPVLDLGVGVASAGKPSSNRDPYNFGTQFEIVSDAGVRIVPGGAYELRLTVGNTLYQNHYPAGYYLAPATGTAPLLGTNTARSGYRSNWNYSAGLSLALFR